MRNFKFLLLSSILLFLNCKKIVPVNYTVKYEVTGTCNPNFYVSYNDIPDEGETAKNNTHFVSMPWSANLAAIGYHKAPYYVKAECLPTIPGWLYVRVYQDNVLVRVDSAQGTSQVIELAGNLPK